MLDLIKVLEERQKAARAAFDAETEQLKKANYSEHEILCIRDLQCMLEEFRNAKRFLDWVVQYARRADGLAAAELDLRTAQLMEGAVAALVAVDARAGTTIVQDAKHDVLREWIRVATELCNSIKAKRELVAEVAHAP